jgi:hypothetical protein
MGRSALRTCLFAGALLAAADSPAQIPAQDPGQDRFAQALGALKPQRPGIVDAYVIVAALDPTPVFGREAREAGRVLARRFDAAGRTLVLANDEGADKADAAATFDHLRLALQRDSALMDRDEDVIVLYTTSHGSPDEGLNLIDAADGSRVITPPQLAAMLDGPAFRNRLIILQACFSGQFVPSLQSPGTVVVTAASAMTSSFGCASGNDWTFFGYALINEAMRQPDTLIRQFRRAFVSILGWEERAQYKPSSPQISVGKNTSGWLAALDAHASAAASSPVGRPPAEIAR